MEQALGYTCVNMLMRSMGIKYKVGVMIDKIPKQKVFKRVCDLERSYVPSKDRFFICMVIGDITKNDKLISGGRIKLLKEITEQVILSRKNINLQKIAFQTPKICSAAIKQYPLNFIYVRNKTLELCKLAIQLNPNNLCFVPEPTLELCQLAADNGFILFGNVIELYRELRERKRKSKIKLAEIKRNRKR